MALFPVLFSFSVIFYFSFFLYIALVAPEHPTTFLRLVGDKKGARGLDFMVPKDRLKIGQVIGGLLDLLEAEVQEAEVEEADEE